MEDQIIRLRKQFQEEIAAARSSKDAEDLKVKYLGKKSALQDLIKFLRESNSSDKPLFGKKINELKEEFVSTIDTTFANFQLDELNDKIKSEKIDVTLPGRRRFTGRMHPISQILEEVIGIFAGMGFSVQYGPDIDSDYYNYEGLNFPEDHPARDMQDTFYINSEMLLRSHTSNTQLRVMEKTHPPIRIIAPGTVYRNEDISARSHVFFHQVEGLYVDTDVSFADLLVLMEEFCTRLFHKKIETRFRPSFFPFVEPGVEIDIRCISCGGAGCRLCKNSGWLEIGGAGMVHPEVLKNGGIDPEQYSGFAWGIGIERIAMLRYGIKDIRLFAENDLRFLSQF